MFTLDRLPLLALLVTSLLAVPLSAQRYPERDHTVFHRTPSTPAKHQMQGVASRSHVATSTTAANGSSHSANPAGSQGGSYNGSAANGKPGAITPSESNEHPQQ